MKLKLFICTFAIFLTASQFCSAAIRGVKSVPEVQEEQIQETDIAEHNRYEQKYGIKQNNDTPRKHVSDGRKETTPRKHVSDGRKETAPRKHVSDGRRENNKQNVSSGEENIKCVTDENNLLFCTDEKNKPYTGKRDLKNANGTNISAENLREGYLDGLCTYFDDKGQRKERTYYKKGIKNGMYKVYYSNNNIKILASYREGLLNGVSDVYETNGSLRGRMKYKNGYLESGYCKNGDKKEDFSKKTIKSYPFNTLETCGSTQ